MVILVPKKFTHIVEAFIKKGISQMSNIQNDADNCIVKYRAQQQRLSVEIEKHGLPIRMFQGQNTTLWRFNDGYEFEITDYGYI